MFPSSTKREGRNFHIVGRAEMAKKCTRKRDARTKLLFFYSLFAVFVAVAVVAA